MTEKITRRDWFTLAAVLLAALLLRLLFFTGFFGSDELTYSLKGHEIAQGQWLASDYIGAVRLGVNLPVGFFMWLLGNSEFAANLWSLACSLGEIALVFLLARAFWGAPAAMLAALLLAFTPLHAHLATRLLADAPLGFFITLSFFALFRGEMRGEGGWWYLLAGLAAGFVWWIKSAVALVYVLVFLVYLVAEKRLAAKWFVMAAGFLAMVTLNALIFLVMQGDFWHLVRMTTSGAAEYVQQANIRTEAGYYFHYLFLDIRHTWLLGPLALAGLLVGWRRADAGVFRVGVWAVGLVALFSFFIVSFSTLTFISKQVNYMTIFLAPLALLGGYALSQLPAPLRRAVLAPILLLGVLGSAAEQVNIRSFVANSPSTQSFADSTHGIPVYASVNAVRYSTYAHLFSWKGAVAKVRDLDNLKVELLTLDRVDSRGFVAYAVLDPQTISWGKSSFTRPGATPACWRQTGQLDPTVVGAGFLLLGALKPMLAWMPFSEALTGVLDGMLMPKPAVVYGIPAGCSIVNPPA